MSSGMAAVYRSWGPEMLKWVLIAVGGGFGSVLRYAMQGLIQQTLPGKLFPLGTMCVNLLGCLLIGILSGYFAGPRGLRIPQDYQIGLLIGVLGGFTTFSTFGFETFKLLNGGQYALAALNIVLSCGLGLAAVWFGYRLIERLYGV